MGMWGKRAAEKQYAGITKVKTIRILKRPG
jgi:hypothetical protein